MFLEEFCAMLPIFIKVVGDGQRWWVMLSGTAAKNMTHYVQVSPTNLRNLNNLSQN